MAPAANVLYYGGASCFDDDLLASLSRIVADNKASIVSNSWGEPTFFVDPRTVIYATIDQDLVDAYESVFKQGAVQGIGFYFSSGDDGDDLAAWGFKHPDYPTGDPWVTVGRRHVARHRTAGTGCSRPAGARRSTTSRPTAPRGRRRFRSCTARAAASARSSRSRGISADVSRAGRRTRRAGHRDGRRPDDRHADRRDAGLPARQPLRPGRRSLRRVPRRRHEPRSPLMAGARPSRRSAGGGPASRTR